MPLLHLYLDVQMDDSLDSKSAHAIIDNFEKRIKDEVPTLEKITTHIETETSELLTIGTRKGNQSTIFRENKKLIFIC